MHIDRAEAEDGNDGRLGLAGWHAVVVRGTRGALHIATRPDGYCILRLEILPAVDKPCAVNHHLDPVGRIGMWCAEPPRIPFHHHQIWTRSVEISVQHGHFAAVWRQGAPRLKNDVLIVLDECFTGVRAGFWWRRQLEFAQVACLVTGGDRCQQQWPRSQERPPVQSHAAHPMPPCTRLKEKNTPRYPVRNRSNARRSGHTLVTGLIAGRR